MAGYIIVSVMILIVCVLLILVVLIQNSKGGGLTSTFSSQNQVLGVKKTADFLEKSTWTMAIALFSLTLATIFVIPRGTVAKGDDSNQTLEFLKKNKNVKAVNFQENPNNPLPSQGNQTAPAPAK